MMLTQITRAQRALKLRNAILSSDFKRIPFLSASWDMYPRRFNVLCSPYKEPETGEVWHKFEIWPRTLIIDNKNYLYKLANFQCDENDHVHIFTFRAGSWDSALLDDLRQTEGALTSAFIEPN